MSVDYTDILYYQIAVAQDMLGSSYMLETFDAFGEIYGHDLIYTRDIIACRGRMPWSKFVVVQQYYNARYGGFAYVTFRGLNIEPSEIEYNK